MKNNLKEENPPWIGQKMNSTILFNLDEFCDSKLRNPCIGPTCLRKYTNELLINIVPMDTNGKTPNLVFYDLTKKSIRKTVRNLAIGNTNHFCTEIEQDHYAFGLKHNNVCLWHDSDGNEIEFIPTESQNYRCIRVDGFLYLAGQKFAMFDIKTKELGFVIDYPDLSEALKRSASERKRRQNQILISTHRMLHTLLFYDLLLLNHDEIILFGLENMLSYVYTISTKSMRIAKLEKPLTVTSSAKIDDTDLIAVCGFGRISIVKFDETDPSLLKEVAAIEECTGYAMCVWNEFVFYSMENLTPDFDSGRPDILMCYNVKLGITFRLLDTRERITDIHVSCGPSVIVVTKSEILELNDAHPIFSLLKIREKFNQRMLKILYNPRHTQCDSFVSFNFI